MPGSESFAARALPRWHTTFGRWVDEIGVPSIVSHLSTDPDLKCTRGAVYGWLDGHRPRPERAQALVEMSGGRLTLDAIYNHRSELAALRREWPTEAARSCPKA